MSECKDSQCIEIKKSVEQLKAENLAVSQERNYSQEALKKERAFNKELKSEIVALKSENGKLYAAHDDLNLDIEWNLLEIADLKSKLAKAKTALEFYADKNNWLTHVNSQKSGHRICIDYSDVESFEKRTNHKLESQYESGGKLARQAISEIGEG